jgi:predicted enzyme related to lactoylglutathione lyase
VGRTGGPRYGAAVPTRLWSVVLAATDPPSLARFWSVATGWPAEADASGVVAVEPPAGSHEPGIPLVFVPNADPKAGKNRVHLDLNTRSADDQAATVERLRAAGARPVDIGQRDVPWVVLADPEGNELCVLDPRDEYAATGPVAAVVMDTPDPASLAPFWSAATGWPAEVFPSGDARLTRPDGRGPRLELLRSADPKVGRNRVHVDVAPFAGDDHAAEVDRLRALGATDVDVGQGDVPWVVLADPQGNELCVLTPRG